MKEDTACQRFLRAYQDWMLHEGGDLLTEIANSKPGASILSHSAFNIFMAGWRKREEESRNGVQFQLPDVREEDWKARS
jgi:hypothetical protein